MLKGKGLYWLWGLAILLAAGEGNSWAQSPAFYRPLPLPFNTFIEDKLSPEDMPTGEGGFARDYGVSLQSGEHIAIDLQSRDFDPVVILIAPDGSTLGANDDAPLGGPDALLLARIPTTGIYTIRVRAFGSPGLGLFQLKVSPLR
jgi:hypothetical protein